MSGVIYQKTILPLNLHSLTSPVKGGC